MQFLTAKSVLYIRVGLLLLLAFYLVTAPELLGTFGFVVLLGQAMQVKFKTVSPDNPVLGVLVVFVVTAAISDLIPLLADNVNYFETIVPTRLAGYFILATYSYFADSEYFSTNLVFVYTFFEIWINFLAYNNLRDEKYYRVKKFVEENEEEIKELEGQAVVPIED